jgi:DMSO/TMAO reductase YedYZ molybdopterin-dependent catalytic subunit
MVLLGARFPSLAGSGHSDDKTDRWPAQIAMTFPSRPGEEVVPWLDQPAPNPVPDILGTPLRWEDFDSWITPNDEFFTVKHYNLPEVAPTAWRLEIHGLVERSITLSLDDLKARETIDVPFTLECSGNHGLPFLIGAVGNAVWTGTPLAPLLQEAGVLAEGSEVVFWGTDLGPQEVNGVEYTEQFARSMSLAEAMDPRNILCWGMNGEPLPAEHGAPVRLIAPGWYGIANVKWLQRIEILDRPYEGRFMAREYVTIREEERDGVTLARFTSVGHDRLKSVPAKVTRLDGQYRVIGVAYGAPIARVDVRIDDGDWVETTIEKHDDSEHTWEVWSLDWGQPAPGEHMITSRAIDTEGNIQPAMDDPIIANKLTFWESNGQITRRVATGAPSLPGTDYTISGEFLAFWEQHGGLAIFGYPITNTFDEVSLIDGQIYRVQYFERQRFELHPENQPPYTVLLGLLGVETLPGTEAYPRTEPNLEVGCQFFDPTGHNVCGRFLNYWREHGGLTIFGYPITEEMTENGLTVQYFERARCEYHPDNDPPYDVLLGLLGRDVLNQRYGSQLPAGAE